MPKADTLVYTNPSAAVVIITNEGTALTPAVKAQFEREGYKVLVLSFPNMATAGLNDLIPVAGFDDASIKQAIAQVTAQYASVGSFIHLHPHFEFKNGNFAQHFKTEKTILQSVFLLAKYLQAPLNQSNDTHRKAFMTVSRLDGKLGLGGRGNISILAGGLSGLVKSLNLEWSSVYCRALDFQPELAATDIAQNIINEWHDADVHYTEVGISDEGRTTFETTKTVLNERETISADITKNDVFLVSGGGRGVTASCIIEMAQKFQNKFILIGRSNINTPIPAYAVGITNESELKTLIMNDLKAKGEKADINTLKKTYNNIIAKQEIDETIAKIKAVGGDVVYISGDVNDLSGVKAELQAVTQQWGTITGLIHGAGMLADKLIQNKTEADFNNVLSVKLDGLLSMLQVVNINALKHVVLFSSVAGFYGNVGQTDYAMANEILSKAAHLFKRNHPKTKVSAINWGAWEGGMVSPELKKKFLEAGVVLVNHAGGAAMFVNEFNVAYDAQAQVIIGGTLPTPESALSADLKTYTVKRALNLKDNPFLNHHSIQGKAVLPVVNAAAWMADTCANCYPDFKLFKMDNLQLFKGIVFDGTEREAYFTEAKEVQKSSEYIVFDVTVYSQGAKLPTFHYKAQVTLRHKNTKATPAAFTPKAVQAGHNITGQTVYSDGTLFHGTNFQGIESILDYSETHLLAKCKANQLTWATQGQFPVNTVNTFFADIQYQGMLVWVAKFHDGAKSLPLHTTSATVYKDMPFDKTLFVQIDIIENTPFKMSANCTVYDEQGAIYVKTEGAAVTISKELRW